jgi:signal peptidase II
LKSKLRSNFFLFGIAFAVILIDQVSKTLVRQNLGLGETWMPISWLAPFFRFIYWKNTGAAFGIFQNGNTILKVLSSIIAVVVVIYSQQVPASQKLVRISMGLMLGGAIGNLIDRFTQGYVTDFISVGSFPVFNVADSCVTVGVGLLVLATILEENKQGKAKESSTTPDSDKTAETEENKPAR